MCGNFGRETWRKPWKLRSTGVAVIKTSRRKSTELRLTVIVRFAVMFYLRSKPVCLINRRNDRPSLHRVAWKFDEFQWEFLQGWNSSCARHGIRSMLPSVNLWSERGANTRHGRVIGDGGSRLPTFQRIAQLSWKFIFELPDKAHFAICLLVWRRGQTLDGGGWNADRSLTQPFTKCLFYGIADSAESREREMIFY